MKINEAKNRLNEARGLIYNLIHFYIMQISLDKKQTPPQIPTNKKVYSLPPQFNTKILTWLYRTFSYLIYAKEYMQYMYKLCKQINKRKLAYSPKLELDTSEALWGLLPSPSSCLPHRGKHYSVLVFMISLL